MRVSIITVNFNQQAHTRLLLESLRRQQFTELEIMVVDNGSRANEADILQADYPEIKALRSEQNLGFAGGNNLALAHAQGEFLFFVNNDAEVAPGCIEALTDFLNAHPNAGIVSPLICYGPMPEDRLENTAVVQYAGMTPVNPFTGRNATEGKGEPLEKQLKTPHQTAYAHGAAMMTPRRVLESVGPMDEDYFLYYEELDWCERMRNAGLEIWVEPRARVWHQESATMKTLGATQTYYLNRNRVLFMRRHTGRVAFLIFICYFSVVALPKQAVKFIFQNNWSGISALLKGYWWNIRQLFS